MSTIDKFTKHFSDMPFSSGRDAMGRHCALKSADALFFDYVRGNAYDDDLWNVLEIFEEAIGPDILPIKTIFSEFTQSDECCDADARKRAAEYMLDKLKPLFRRHGTT